MYKMTPYQSEGTRGSLPAAGKNRVAPSCGSPARAERIEFRFVCKADIPRIIENHRRIYGAVTDEGYWNWMLFSRPVPQTVTSGAFLADGTLIGMVGALPHYCQIDGKKEIGVQACDLAIARDYCGGCTFRHLESLAQEKAESAFGRPFFYGFTRKWLRPYLSRVLGYSVIGELCSWTRTVMPASMVGQKIHSCLRLPRMALGMLLRLPVDPDLENLEVRLEGRCGPEFDRFWEMNRCQFVHSGWHDSEWLNWRYNRCPKGEYEILSFRREGSLAGWLVVCLDETRGRRARIVDLLPESGERKSAVLEVMLREAIEWASRRNATRIGLWGWKNDQWAHVLRRLKFRAGNGPGDFLFRERGPEPLSISKATRENYSFRLGDFDWS